MSDLRARAGDPIRAQQWNSVVDRLDNHASGFASATKQVSRVEVSIRNTTGRNLDIGELVNLDGWDGPDGSNPYETTEHAAYRAIDPVWHSGIARCVVVAEPIPRNLYGKAVVSGQCLARVQRVEPEELFVMVDPTNPTRFRSAASGIGRLLARVSQTLAMINFRDEATRWAFQLTADSEEVRPTPAQLFDRTATFFADEVVIDDPLGVIDCMFAGEGGWCLHHGDRFIAIADPC